MADYLVVCVKREPCPKAPGCSHVTKIGTGEPTYYTTVWTIAEVCEAIAQQNRFSYRAPNRRLIELACVLCPGCLEVQSLEVEGLPPLP
jgi:hypothetical protein